MAYALRVLMAFIAATAASEVVDYFVRAPESLGTGNENAWVRILVYAPPLVAALWAAASAKRVQNAFAAGLIWALVAHVGHALAAGHVSDPVFYWTRALVYRSALCVGVVVMIWGTLRRLGRMRGERTGERHNAEDEDAAATERRGEPARAWAVFSRATRQDGDAPASSARRGN